MNKTHYLGFFAALAMTCSSCIVPQQVATQQPTSQTQQRPVNQQPTQSGQQTPTHTSQDPLGDLLGGIVNAGAASAEQNSGSLGGVLGNILASVAGSITTTQANLVGTWSYYEPCVQFESENLLKKAGGAAAAAKMESQIAPIYQMVGITPGKVTFTFTNDGRLSYTIGSRTQTGSYVFDSKNKTVAITTANGLNITAYVTISGRNMSLCFDSSKVLSLFSAAGSLSNSSSILGTLGTIAQTYSGMKTGFKFKK